MITTDAGPAPAATPVRVTGSLSPSRASDFRTCPLRYRFRCVDRLPDPPDAVLARGTLVHAVLEALFSHPPAGRTAAAAAALVAPTWRQLRATDPELADVPGTDDAWLAGAAALVERYFTLEDPRTVRVEARELLLTADATAAGDGVVWRGCLDRLDRTADGLVVTDYKTGRSPDTAGEAAALFQLKFYGLLLRRALGVTPHRLRLIYLGDATILTVDVTADELDRFERIPIAVWHAVRDAVAARDFTPRPGRSCTWCPFRALCPAHGGTPPPFPAAPDLTDPRDLPAPRGGLSRTPTPQSR